VLERWDGRTDVLVLVLALALPPEILTLETTTILDLTTKPVSTLDT
jgi:hypothetical protein